MLFSVIIILFLQLFPLSIQLSDDYTEHISVNTGETATFICDLPERYSNKPVRFIVIYHYFSFFYIYKKRLHHLLFTWEIYIYFLGRFLWTHGTFIGNKDR